RMMREAAERGHAAHRATDQCGKPLDAESANERVRCVARVLQREFGKIEAPGIARFGIDRSRTTGTLATAQRIRADHEPAVRVDGLAGSYDVFPPAGRIVHRIAGRVRAG